MIFKKIILVASIIFSGPIAMAGPEQKPIDLNETYSRYEEAGYTPLELMETTKQVLISAVVIDVSQSFVGNSIVKVGAHDGLKELARLSPANSIQENKLKTLKAGAKLMAICDLAFSSGSLYMSFGGCYFK